MVATRRHRAIRRHRRHRPGVRHRHVWTRSPRLALAFDGTGVTRDRDGGTRLWALLLDQTDAATKLQMMFPTLADQRSFVLSKSQWSTFLAAFDGPVRSLPRMQHLLTEPGFFDSELANKIEAR